MAILNPGDWPIDPNVVDGTELAARLNRLQQVITSGNANATRPAGLAAGSVWAQTGPGAGDLTLKLFDGATDHTIGSVIGGVAKFGGATFTTGATASKPATPSKGDIFYDTTLQQYEIYDGGAWKSGAVFGTGYSPEITLTDAASIAWDTSIGQVAKVTLAGNRTIATPANLKNGAFYSLRVNQDATGGRTLAFSTNFKFSGAAAPNLTTAANAIDFFTFRSDGTNLYEQGSSYDVK